MYKQFTTSVIVFKEIKAFTDVLLIHHKKFDRWMIPGGHIEPIENPNEGAIREVIEETGIKIHLISFIHQPMLVEDGEWLFPPEYMYQQRIPASPKEGFHFHIDLTYIGVADNYDLSLNSKETYGVMWTSISKIKDLHLFDATRTTIMDAYNKLVSNLNCSLCDKKKQESVDKTY
ncbi:NUDIX hydrolase [Terrimonas pollutisoli]|uniref:NUDIX hydrolase n=1 Tax=Terrimonas pollutisoli TaxID=3034147 RepID=UPI0023ED4B02|nr:NUDIX domain-containing protein [Terrimonas sp. H1YJ31]